MNLKQYRELSRLKTAVQFARDNAPIFISESTKAGPSKGQQILAELDSLIAQITDARVAQVAGAESVGTMEKNALRASIQGELGRLKSSISYIAAERSTPALKDYFPLRRGINDEELTAHAIGFCDAIARLGLEFDLVALEHAPGFLEKLRADIAGFVSADARQTSAVQDKAGATASLKPLLDRAKLLLKGLDAIIKNKFKDNAEKLGAWKSAMHLERNNSKHPAPIPVPPRAVQPLVEPTISTGGAVQPNGQRAE